MSDIGNMHVHARKTLELVFRIATASLGEEEGCHIAISIVKALYRLKMSGQLGMHFWRRTQSSVFDTHLAGRIPMYGSIISKRPAGDKYYLHVHTDNICAFLHEAKDAMTTKLEQMMFKLKVE